MWSSIILKYNKIRCEAELVKESIPHILIRKVFRKIIIIIRLGIDICAFLFCWPLLALALILVRIKSSKRKVQKIALFAGLEHVIEKSSVRAERLYEDGITSRFYSLESTGNSIKPKNYWSIIRAGKLDIVDLFKFVSMVLYISPLYVELYFEGNYYRQLWYSLVCRIGRIPSVAILRGELYELSTLSAILKKSFILTLHNVDLILYRELYMMPMLVQYGLAHKNIIFDYNKVKVKECNKFSRKSPNVLFLNGFKTWRRLDVVVKSIPLIRKEVPDSSFTLVGARSALERTDIENLIQEMGLGHGIDVRPWTNDPEEYYSNASVFVLPADLIYVNFSLLEAMERGVPPVVANVKDADKIVHHGINGFLCEQNEHDLAKNVILLLKDESLRMRLAIEARKTIVEHFNDKDRMEPIIDFVKRYYESTR